MTQKQVPKLEANFLLLSLYRKYPALMMSFVYRQANGASVLKMLM